MKYPKRWQKISVKCKIANPTYFGKGSKFNFALVTAAKVPSDPTIIFTKFNYLVSNHSSY